MSSAAESRTRATGQLTVPCPYCGDVLLVDERCITALRVSTSVGDVPRIDVEFLAKHRCASRP